jgi:hypothetical protein
MTVKAPSRGLTWTARLEWADISYKEALYTQAAQRHTNYIECLYQGQVTPTDGRFRVRSLRWL